MSIEAQVAGHYTRGDIERTILDGLAASGKNIERLTTTDLSAADELHLGWLPATMELAKSLGLSAGMHVLDIGSGLGGPGRYFAEACGCRVTGIDLTQEFVDVANNLTRRCGLADRALFKQASALALPFGDTTFDAATMIHVGMNIKDKPKLFSEARRVLKPGGRFGVYDIARITNAELPYPMPWAATPETSFVERPAFYRQALEAAGFSIETERNQREFVLSTARAMREKAAAEGAPPIGPNVTATPERLANVMRTLELGTIAPVEIIARAA